MQREQVARPWPTWALQGTLLLFFTLLTFRTGSKVVRHFFHAGEASSFFHPIHPVELLLFLFPILFIWKVKERRTELFACASMALLLILSAVHSSYDVRVEVLCVILAWMAFFLVYCEGQISRRLFALLAILGSFQAAVALLQYFTGRDVGLTLFHEFPLQKDFASFTHKLSLLHYILPFDDVSDIVRALGTFPHPNILGGFFVMTILATTFLFFEEKRRIWRECYAIALFLQLYALPTTFSRSALFGLCAALPILVKRKKALFMALAVGSALLFYLPPLLDRGGVFNYNELARASDSARIRHHTIALEMIQDEPLLGVGIGATEQWVKAHGFASADAKVYPVHNIFLLVATEVGVPAALLFALLMGLLLRRGWRRRDRPNVSLLLAIFVAFLFIGLFDFYLLGTTHGRMLFFSCLALLMAATRDREEELKRC